MSHKRETMRLSWTRFLHSSLAAQHAVQVYETPGELADSVGAYLAAGFDLSEPAIVLATPEHWAVFARRLAACGWEQAQLERLGLLRLEDAEATLRLLLDHGQPSP